MRLLIKFVAVVAAVTVVGTLCLIVAFDQLPHSLYSLVHTDTFGVLSDLGLGITLIVGTFAAVQLWRCREAGRRAGILLFGYSLVYWVAIFPAFRWAQASTGLIVGAAILFGVPLGVLLWPRARGVLTVPARGR